jgi:hypothetical protein
MSQYGDGDYCSVFENRWITSARKAHTCNACGESIHGGHRYHVTFSVFDGEPNTTKRCERCQAIYEHLSARMRTEGEPEEYCDPALHCGHTYEENWDEPPPEHIAALAFWRPGDPSPRSP